MMMAMMLPATVKTYDADKRICTIEIEGLTDGATVLPEAEICYPIGDKSHDTEIEILSGDKVWIAFQGGDTRKPIIMGYRCPETGNIVSLRKWHKENIHLIADDEIKLATVAVLVQCETLTVTATESVDITSPTMTFNGATVFNGLSTFNEGATVASGDLSVTTGNITAAAGNISATAGSISTATIDLDSHHHTDAESRPTTAAQT